MRDRVDGVTVLDAAPAARLRAFILECLRIYDDYRINYPILFNEMIFLSADQQRELRAIEDGPVKLLDAILVEIRPELVDTKVLRTPVTLLVFGTINWTYTWFNPDGRMKTDQLASLILDFVTGGVSTMRLDGKY